MLKFFLAVFVMIFSSLCMSWEQTDEFHYTPWIKDQVSIVEYNYPKNLRYFFDLGASRKREFRFIDTYSQSFNDDEVNKGLKKLIGNMENIDQYKVPGKAFDNKAHYFAHKRFFLISLDPQVMLIVPYDFKLRGAVEIGNHYLDHGLYDHIAIPRWEQGLHCIWTKIDGWFNYVELTPVVPVADGITVVSDKWEGEKDLNYLINDSSWNFMIDESKKHFGYLEFYPKIPTD